MDRRGALRLRQRPRDDDAGRARACSNRVWFGFDAERLLVRVDTEGGPARERLAEADRLRIGFVDPAEREIVVLEPAVASSRRLS